MTDIITEENCITNSAFDGNGEKSSAAEDTRENSPEKTFTQSQLEALISERLKRERKNTENLRSVKDLLCKLSDSGVIKSSSYSDMAKELSARLSEKEYVDDQSQGEIAGAEAEEAVTGIEAAEENEGVSGKTEKEPRFESELSVKSLSECAPGEVKTDAYTLSSGDARAIKRAYPECDIGELLCDDAFERFACGRSGPIEKIYGDYLTFMTVLEGKNENLERRMFAENASTSFSASDKAYSSDGSEGLTKRQMEIARQSGMSYREYSRLLSDIPGKIKL